MLASRIVLLKNAGGFYCIIHKKQTLLAHYLKPLCTLLEPHVCVCVCMFIFLNGLNLLTYMHPVKKL